MSNLFQEVLTDAKGVEDRLLGSTYTYYKNIKTTSEIDMSDKSIIQQTGKDIQGLIQYVELLLSGNSKASLIGNKFLLNTDVIENLNLLNPFAIMSEFLSDSKPPCQKITMQTITNDNIKSSETHYFTLADINNMDPCTFPDKKNPVTGKKCKETFENLQPEILMPDDPLAQLYFASLGIVGLFFLYRLMEKSR